MKRELLSVKSRLDIKETIRNVYFFIPYLVVLHQAEDEDIIFTIIYYAGNAVPSSLG